VDKQRIFIKEKVTPSFGTQFSEGIKTVRSTHGTVTQYINPIILVCRPHIFATFARNTKYDINKQNKLITFGARRLCTFLIIEYQ